jgi:hypothetical protein
MEDIDALEQALTGTPHEYDALMNKLQDFPVQRYIQGVQAEELIRGMF